MVTLEREKVITIPKALMYEMLDGKVIPYRGYEKVLAKKTNLESIMGSSGLQSLVIDIISNYLRGFFKQYRFLNGGLGLHFSHKSNFSADIAMYPKAVILENANTNYLDTPPRAVIEVDTKADLSGFEDEGVYFTKKTQRLLDFGVEIVVWFFTSDQKMIIAKPNQPWLIVNFDYTFDFLGHEMNVKNVLTEEGLKF